VQVRPRGITPLWACSAVGFLLCSLAVGVLAGPVDLGLGGILESAGAHLHLPGVTSSLTPTEEAILWQIRVPRVVLAALVGGMLARAGATYQGVFRNPLADPYLLGVAAGAGLGATVAIAYLPEGIRGQRALPVAAFLGAVVAVVLTYAVGKSARRERDPATLVLAGVTVAAFFTAWQTFLQQRSSETLQQVYSWILGNIPSSGWSDVVLVLPYIAVATVVILSLRRVVDVLNLGDDEAASLGVDVRRVRFALVAAATLGTAAAVAVTGLIGFVGIIVPHAIRLVSGIGYRALLPLSFVVGAGFLVLADVVARTALSPAEIPLGVVTAFFGAPFFALVLRTTRGGSG
jgi:iron complex transport system permease protein